MRSLALKLTLAFLFVSLIGAVLAAYFIQQRTQSEFDRFLFDLDQSNLVNFLGEYYETEGNWKQVGEVIEQLPGPTGMHRSPAMRLQFSLLNQNGRVVYGNIGRMGAKVKNYQEGVPIEVDGQVVGWLIANQMPHFQPPASPENTFLRNVNQSIFLSALISVIIALLLGAILARTLTRSLRELTKATKIVAGGDLGYQVEVRSRDEIGDLATSFNDMSADLAKSNRARRQMTADIAHDLRTPLSVILGYTEALSDGKLEGSTHIYDVMHQEAGHLQHLIDYLRTLSLADAGELPLNIQEVSPRALLERSVAAFKPQADHGDISLRVDAEANLPLIHVDPERMAQVLGNLVNNSLRYTPAGGQVELTASSGQGGVYLRVKDNGAGIAAEDLPHVFNRFYRGSKSRLHNGEAGLGLSIAKSLVKAQGGTISVDSKEGVGTTFTIEFPG
jgi:signal transduction histidine kinase